MNKKTGQSQKDAQHLRAERESLTSFRPARPAENADRPAFNDAESPLSWLRGRRGRDGRPILTDEQYLAGERLRMDFERAHMARRITTNWDVAGSGGRGGNIAAEMSDSAIAARERYQRAIAAVGPELASILVQVCCMASGLEEAERHLNLPQRSGKAVLGLALTSLARHYGLLRPGARQGQSTRSWGADGYRPEVPEFEEA